MNAAIEKRIKSPLRQRFDRDTIVTRGDKKEETFPVLFLLQQRSLYWRITSLFLRHVTLNIFFTEKNQTV